MADSDRDESASSGAESDEEAGSPAAGSGSEAGSNRSRSEHSGDEGRHSDQAHSGDEGERSEGEASGSGDEGGVERSGDEGSDGEAGNRSVRSVSSNQSPRNEEGSDGEAQHSGEEHSGDEGEARSGAASSDEEGEHQERRRSDSEASHSDVERSSPRHSESSRHSGEGSPRSGGERHSDDEASQHSNASGSDRSAKHSDNEGSQASDNEEADNRSQASGRGSAASGGEEDKGKESGSEDEEGNKRQTIDSDDEGSQIGRKRVKAIADSDDEENGEKQAAGEANELFGDADDISSDSGGEESKQKEMDDGGEGTSEGPQQHNFVDEDEEDQAPVEVPETRIDVEIPKIGCNLGKEVHFVKLPNFLSVETRPFDHQTYEDEIDEDEVLDEEGRARLKLKVENTMRWRWGVDEEANPIRESNAKLIRWSDGSISLHLGSEVFDVYKQILQGDHNHLFIRQGTGLLGQSVFRTKLSFRPHSTESFTHLKLTMSMADRSQKTQKIRVLPTVGMDPEAHRDELIKKEEDRLKASLRRESKVRRMKERSHSRGLSQNYLEGDGDDEGDDEGGISLAAIKNKYKKGGMKEMRQQIYSSESEGSDIEVNRAKRLERSKQGGGDSDDEEDRPKKKMARIEDSDDDE